MKNFLISAIAICLIVSSCTNNLVHFEIEGPGTIVGVANANPVNLESNQQLQRKAWQGRCIVIVKSGKKEGNLILKATADGLAPASIQINIR